MDDGGKRRKGCWGARARRCATRAGSDAAQAAEAGGSEGQEVKGQGQLLRDDDDDSDCCAVQKGCSLATLWSCWTDKGEGGNGSGCAEDGGG
jgi:hypothetical protein